MSMWRFIKQLFERTPSEYERLKVLSDHQRINGVDLGGYRLADGCVEALVCNCGLFRRDKPPGAYLCRCGRYLWSPDATRKIMCPSCSQRIIEGRSSWASYTACDACKNTKKEPEPSDIPARA